MIFIRVLIFFRVNCRQLFLNLISVSSFSRNLFELLMNLKKLIVFSIQLLHTRNFWFGVVNWLGLSLLLEILIIDDVIVILRDVFGKSVVLLQEIQELLTWPIVRQFRRMLLFLLKESLENFLNFFFSYLSNTTSLTTLMHIKVQHTSRLDFLDTSNLGNN